MEIEWVSVAKGLTLAFNTELQTSVTSGLVA